MGVGIGRDGSVRGCERTSVALCSSAACPGCCRAMALDSLHCAPMALVGFHPSHADHWPLSLVPSRCRCISLCTTVAVYVVIIKHLWDGQRRGYAWPIFKNDAQAFLKFKKWLGRDHRLSLRSRHSPDGVLFHMLLSHTHAPHLVCEPVRLLLLLLVRCDKCDV